MIGFVADGLEWAVLHVPVNYYKIKSGRIA
jgi:hypothetical protein